MIEGDPTLLKMTKENIAEKRVMFDAFLAPALAMWKDGYQAYAD